MASDVYLPVNYAIILLVGHWIGDYLLQGNKIAARKSRSVAWLALHVSLYTLILFSVSLIIFSGTSLLLFIAVNAGLHFVTDLLTGKLYNRFRENPRIFFPILGLDQLIHGVTLLLTASWVIGK
jgi:Protein of unknown function (DUF3307)